MTRRRNDRLAFVFIDVTMGLALLGLIAIALLGAVGRQQRAAQKLSDDRTAARLAEDALTSLRLGQTKPSTETNAVVFSRLPDTAPSGHVWLRATTHVGQSEAQVIGLVPSAAAPATEGGKP
jgi:type II secretory pathway pseudopilin PulG